MSLKHALVLALAISTATAVPAAEQQPAGVEEKPEPCTVDPVFHCVQTLGDGAVIGHFGYRYRCADGSEPESELFIEIGKDNRFTPGSDDRGQSKVFWAGEHVASLEVEFSAEELEKQTALAWTVQGRTARVDYTRSSDGSLDCSTLPK